MTAALRVLPSAKSEQAWGVLDTVLLAAEQCAFQWDCHSDELLWLHAPAAQVLGHPLSDLRRMSDWLALVHADDREVCNAANTIVRTDADQSLSVEYRVRSADGRWRWIESRGRRIRSEGGRRLFIGVVSDISARKGTENRLALCALVLETVRDAVHIVDRRGQLVWANSAAASLFGLPLAQLQGQPIAALSAEEPARQVELQQEMRTAIERHGFWTGRLNAQHTNGSWIPTEASVTRIVGDDGELWVSVRRDLRERLQLESAAAQLHFLQQQQLGAGLHESLGQELAAAAMLLHGARQSAGASPLGSQLAEVDQILRDSVAHCRALAQDVPPFVIEEHGLTAALESLGVQLQHKLRIPVSVAVTLDTQKLGAQTAHGLFDIASGCLQLNHDADRLTAIELRLWRSRGSLLLAIDHLGGAARVEASIATRLLSHRAQSLGATLEWLNLPQGTRRALLELPERFLAEC